MGRTKTHEQFLADLAVKNPTIEVLQRYEKSSIPIECKCKVCGTIWKVRPNNLLTGYGCPTCGLKKRAESRKKENNTFLEEMKKVNPDIEIIGDYIEAKKPLACKCKKCGNEWNAAPTNLLNHKGCPICSIGIRADKKRRSNTDFLEIVKSQHPEIIILEEYRGQDFPVRAKCDLCGYEWAPKAAVLINGRGCPRCAKNAPYTQDEFVNKMKSLNPYVEIRGQYVRSAEPVECKCLRCGHIWNSKPNYLLNGRGCPDCAHTSTSFIEQIILNTFRLLYNGEIIHRNRTAIGKELDIYIPDLKVAIEPGSWRWHRDKTKNDHEKLTLCRKNGIRLLFVFSDYPDDMPPFPADCICVKETLGFEQDLSVVKEIICRLTRICGFNCELTDFQWDSIIKKSYADSRRITTEEFQTKLAGINSTIKIVGDYTGSWNKIACECSVCGYPWETAANNLLQGHGCPNCARMRNAQKYRKNPEEFKKEIKKVHPEITLLSDYMNSKTKITCECSICGYTWHTLPTTLKKGAGCPNCSKRKRE